ncbi:alpha/beta fold hydrolase [Streptomyces sp. NPDC086023]|uniref:alpha/beta fold hydrolase n=1 Tax=Streptomyces sp. NPDC086023 TaxID=3365746 RepID=UPI0037D43DAF
MTGVFPGLAGHTSDHVEGAVRRAHRNGPVVLVGQSLGGVTLNAVANRIPGLIAHLVYASAFCPTRYASAFEEVRALLTVLEPDESAAIGAADARGLPGSWGRVPRTYLRFTEDRSILPALQDLMIREADETTPGNRFRVRSLAAPHIGPRDPAELADELEHIARLCSRGGPPAPRPRRRYRDPPQGTRTRPGGVRCGAPERPRRWRSWARCWPCSPPWPPTPRRPRTVGPARWTCCAGTPGPRWARWHCSPSSSRS